MFEAPFHRSFRQFDMNIQSYPMSLANQTDSRIPWENSPPSVEESFDRHVAIYHVTNATPSEGTEPRHFAWFGISPGGCDWLKNTKKLPWPVTTSDTPCWSLPKRHWNWCYREFHQEPGALGPWFVRTFLGIRQRQHQHSEVISHVIHVYPSFHSLLLNVTIEIVDLAVKKGDFPKQAVSLPAGKTPQIPIECHWIPLNHHWKTIKRL